MNNQTIVNYIQTCPYFDKLSSEQNVQEGDPSISFPIIIGTTLLLSKEQNLERSVATDDDSSIEAGFKKIQINKPTKESH